VCQHEKVALDERKSRTAVLFFVRGVSFDDVHCVGFESTAGEPELKRIRGKLRNLLNRASHFNEQIRLRALIEKRQAGIVVRCSDSAPVQHDREPREIVLGAIKKRRSRHRWHCFAVLQLREEGEGDGGRKVRFDEKQQRTDCVGVRECTGFPEQRKKENIRAAFLAVTLPIKRLNSGNRKVGGENRKEVRN
jgi:hypothetical protein